jgi:8-oxo-dGTP pyrophosphatase MutT (NUDIX family)
MHNWISRLEHAFNAPLPGEAAQLKMAPSLRHQPVGSHPLREGSVMVLVYPAGPMLYTVFMKRPAYHGVHGDQVSFPGGVFEKNDPSLIATAIRETEEETGISGSLIRVIGTLTPIHIPVSNIHVLPVVGILENRPVFRPNPDEVSYLIEVSLNELLNPVNQHIKNLLIANNEVIVPYYQLEGHHIWGATAMILSEFLEIIRKADLY